ncbi:hypothetical protein GPROT2_02596, partial [Gammaproteobacteria bacterium]
EAPQGEVECTLARIWSELLQVQRVGRNDNFFELGGHSLLAVSLIERLRREGLDGGVDAVFATPTLAGLASALDDGAELAAVPANGIPAGCTDITPAMLTLVTLQPAEIDALVLGVPGGAANVQDVYPLTPLQQGMLFHHLMAGEHDPYLLRELYAFDSRERLDAYLGAMQAVIDRHDILRTSLHWEGLREPVQAVWREARLQAETVAAGTADAAEALWHHPRQRRIDLRQAPLLRACIAHDEPGGRWLLLLSLHHVVADHEGLDLLQREVRAHLAGDTGGLPPAAPFRDFVARARSTPDSVHESFFSDMLGDVDEPTLPYGLADMQGDGDDVVQAVVALQPGLAAGLQDAARTFGVTPASLCHLAFAQVLARLCRRDDVVFGTVLFGRGQSGGADAGRGLGLCLNTLPLRLPLDALSARDAARLTHTRLAALLTHEHASLALAQRCSRIAAPAPLFNAILNYRHSERGQGATLPPLPGIEVLRWQERTNYPIGLCVDDFG